MGLSIIVSGPSGVGKGTLVKELLSSMPNLEKAITCTTRKPRTGEIPGINYHFLSIDDFKQQIDSGAFLEYANVHGNLYGTPIDDFNKLRESGKDVILEIDVQGGTYVKGKIPDSILIFIAPPSFEELEHRLRERATDSDDVIESRLRNARNEMSYINKYDYLVINDTINRTSGVIRSIIIAEHARIR